VQASGAARNGMCGRVFVTRRSVETALIRNFRWETVQGNEMDDIWSRIAGNLADRLQGPMNFRFILQPVIASIFGVLSGLKDAKAHRPPYLWALLVNSAHRGDMLKDGWKSIAKVFFVALVLDIIYQMIVSRFVYSGEALIIGFVLTIAPYIIVRGLVNRLAGRK
jgi:hypothetical protein